VNTFFVDLKFATLALVLSAAAVFAQAVLPTGDGVLQFVRATEDYAFMHRRLERRLPVLEVNANPETIRRAIDAMSAAVRAERAAAQPGDLFNPAVRAALRTRIAKALRSHGYTPLDVMAAERAEGVDPSAATLRVNGTFPWSMATAMFPCALEALPPLPPELQYRLVGRDLVLVDVHASVIIDIMLLALGGDTTY
jgi:hypothetical protein